LKPLQTSWLPFLCYLDSVCFCVLKVFLKKFKFYFIFFIQINIFLVFLDYFDALISKIIFKNKKIILF
jgi:hypothetical protein